VTGWAPGSSTVTDTRSFASAAAEVSTICALNSHCPISCLLKTFHFSDFRTDWGSYDSQYPTDYTHMARKWQVGKELCDKRQRRLYVAHVCTPLYRPASVLFSGYRLPRIRLYRRVGCRYMEYDVRESGRTFWLDRCGEAAAVGIERVPWTIDCDHYACVYINTLYSVYGSVFRLSSESKQRCRRKSACLL